MCCCWLPNPSLTLTPRCFAVAKKRGRKPKEKGAPTVPRALAVLQSATLHNETLHVEPGSKRARREVGKHHCLLSLLTVSLQIGLRRAMRSGPMGWLVVYNAKPKPKKQHAYKPKPKPKTKTKVFVVKILDKVVFVVVFVGIAELGR